MVMAPATVVVVVPPMVAMMPRLRAGRPGQHGDRQSGGDNASHLISPSKASPRRARGDPQLTADAVMVMPPAVTMVVMEHRLCASCARQQRHR